MWQSRVVLQWLRMGPTQAVERDRLGPVGHGRQSHTALLLITFHPRFNLFFSGPHCSDPIFSPNFACGKSPEKLWQFLGHRVACVARDRSRESGRSPTQSPSSCQRPPGTSTREKIYGQARRSVRKDTYTVVLTAEFTSSSFICY